MDLREVNIIKPDHIDICTLLSIMYQSGKSFSLISMLIRRLTFNGQDIPVNLLDIFYDRFKVRLKCSPMILQEMIRFNEKLSELMVAVKSVGIKKSKEVANFLMKNIDQWNHRDKIRIDELAGKDSDGMKAYGVLLEFPKYVADNLQIMKKVSDFEDHVQSKFNISNDKR